MNRPKIAYITTIGMSLRYLLLDQLLDLQAAGYDVIAISTHDADAAFVKGAGIRHIPHWRISDRSGGCTARSGKSDAQSSIPIRPSPDC
jgi:hypothetical protein